VFTPQGVFITVFICGSWCTVILGFPRSSAIVSPAGWGRKQAMEILLSFDGERNVTKRRVPHEKDES
jgi:hypothetical protein